MAVQKPTQSMSQITGVKKPLSHTNSLTKLPKYGVETPHEDELEKIYKEIDMWGLDMFKVAQYSNKNPLTSIMYTIFRVSPGFQSFVLIIRFANKMIWFDSMLIVIKFFIMIANHFIILLIIV